MEQLRGGEPAVPMAALVPRGPETAPGAHTLCLTDAAARTCVAWGGRGGVGGGADGEEEEAVAHVGGTVHPEDW